MNSTAAGVARILLIADDAAMGANYRGALEVAGYDVTQAESFVDVLGTEMPDPDMVVLCDLAVFAYPGQTALVLRVPTRMSPDELVAEVDHRIAIRATMLTTFGQAS